MSDASEKPRDWDAELRAIDRMLERAPAGGPPLPEGPAAPPGLPPRSREITSVQWLGTWARVVLGVLVGVGMAQWPYMHSCGWRFMFYLTGIGVVLTAGVWSSLSSWKRRLGVAHVLSQLLIIWGLVLGARAILPRVGYAKQAAPWLCPTPARTSGATPTAVEGGAWIAGARAVVPVRGDGVAGWVGPHAAAVIEVSSTSSQRGAGVARLRGVG